MYVGVHSLTPKSKEKRSLHPFDQFGSQNEYKGAPSAFFRLGVAVMYLFVHSLTPKSKEKHYLRLFDQFGSLANVYLHCFVAVMY